MKKNITLNDHIIKRAAKCIDFVPIMTLDTEGMEKEVVSFSMLSRQGMVTFLWKGGEVGERFLQL